MLEPRVGMAVTVQFQGLDLGLAHFDGPAALTGVIVQVDARGRMVAVKMDAEVSGHDARWFPADRVTAR
jgi:hypothetical protein